MFLLVKHNPFLFEWIDGVFSRLGVPEKHLVIFGPIFIVLPVKFLTLVFWVIFIPFA